MVKKITLSFIVIAALSSCKQSKEDLLCRKWQQVSYENADREKQERETAAFLDTVGQNSTPEQMMQTYGFSNADSFRQSMQAMQEAYKEEEKAIIRKTQFQFNKDGKVFILSGGQKQDSAFWKFEGEDKIVFDEQKMKSVGGQISFKVLSLTKDSLRFQLDKTNNKAVINFVPAK